MSEEITQWEYMEVDAGFGAVDKMNKLGTEGWEATGNSTRAGNCGIGNIILKRPKKAQNSPSRNDGYGYSR